MTIKTACFVVGIVLLLVSAYLSAGARDRLALLAVALLAAAFLA
jgi:hypothetical protein